MTIAGSLTGAGRRIASGQNLVIDGVQGKASCFEVKKEVEIIGCT
ncbi:hypothetical protein AT864_01489 [Anoxybacillus sp. P3H1B]|nr:hypothetical protein AT864_01489 [Anoxybacillus sp. P3H1B]